MPPSQSEGDAQAALELLCAQAPDSFNDLEKTTNIALFDLLQDLCLGGSQRFVRWAHTQDVIEDIKRWVTDNFGALGFNHRAHPPLLGWSLAIRFRIQRSAYQT